jgi:serine/threonine-protein kinase
MDEAKQKAIEGAKWLEKHGRLDAAVELLSQAGIYDEAARILSGRRQFADAAALLMRGVAVPMEQVPALDGEGKKLALMAAVCFARAGQHTEAVALFVALKEHQRAAQVLEKAGDRVGAARVLASAKSRFTPSQPQGIGGAAITLETAKRLEAQGKPELAIQTYVQLKRYGEAARVSTALGLWSDAASFYAEAGMVYEAGASYVRAGDSGKALENFVRLPRDDPRYRAAANEVARLSADLGQVGLRMDHFLARFIEEGPLEIRELESFYLLAKVYEKHDLLENAKELLRKIEAKRPGYRDAAEWLNALEEQTRVSSPQYERILKEEAAHLAVDGRFPASTWSKSSELPPLPDLPPLPRVREVQPSRAMPISSSPPASRSAGKVQADRPNEKMLSRLVSEDVERIARDLNPSAQSAQGSTGDTLFAAGRKSTDPAVSELRPEALAPGTILGDRYRLEEQIGQGGMGVVFRAEDLELADQIALKIFKPLHEDEQALARFRQELQLSRQLVHPNIARLFDIGAYRGCRFISMELLRGSDLKKLLAVPMQIDRGIDLLIQACAGLKAAHDRGIIHRDIKPENLFITSDGCLKILDFGIAKGQLSKGVTIAGMVAGTPEYISPEQIDNFTAVTPASDLYSLGVVAYEMFTGQLPFQSRELVPLLMMQINDSPPPPRSLLPSIPERLEQLLLKLLAKKPEHRFPDGAALAGALEIVRRQL